MKNLLSKIIRGNGHNFYVIEPDDKDEFLAAGFILAGTVTEDAVTRFVVRQKADYERNDINPSQRPTFLVAPDRVGKVEDDVTPPSGDAGGSAEETLSVVPSDADAGVQNSGN